MRHPLLTGRKRLPIPCSRSPRPGSVEASLRAAAAAVSSSAPGHHDRAPLRRQRVGRNLAGLPGCSRSPRPGSVEAIERVSFTQTAPPAPGHHDRAPLRHFPHDAGCAGDVSAPGHHDRAPLRPAPDPRLRGGAAAAAPGHHDRAPLRRTLGRRVRDAFRICSRSPRPGSVEARPASLAARNGSRLLPVTTTGLR